MAFEVPAIIKEHPYATGAVVIVGGIIAFYLLSGSSSSGASSGGSNQAAILQADEAAAQIQAGTQQQNAAVSAQLQAAQIQANAQTQQVQASQEVQDTQTAAQLAAAIYGTQQGTTVTALNDNAAIEEQANQAIFQQNTVAMQDSVLEDQINSGVVENANNNATAVAGAQITAGTNNLALADALTLAQQQEADTYNLTATNNEAYNAEIPYIVTHAGQKQNSLIDATDQTTLFQTALAHGNPAVASVGSSASTSANTNAVTSLNNRTTSIASAGTSLLTGLFG